MLRPVMFINYNQTVSNIRAIHIAASGLESTCLVLVCGLGEVTTHLVSDSVLQPILLTTASATIFYFNLSLTRPLLHPSNPFQTV